MNLAPRARAALVVSEWTKLATAPWTGLLVVLTVVGTWLSAWSNAASGVGVEPDDPRLFSAEPIPLEYQGFEMAGLGSVILVVLASLWAGTEYGTGRQIRSTLLATPGRIPVFLAKVLVLTIAVSTIGILTMWGAIVITHLTGHTGLDPWTLDAAVWSNLGGVTMAWTLTALIAFAVGVLCRSAILPLVLVIPLVIGLGDLLAGIWSGGRYLPVAAGASLYSAPAPGLLLDSVTGGIVQSLWAVAAVGLAATAFVRRDV